MVGGRPSQKDLQFYQNWVLFVCLAVLGAIFFLVGEKGVGRQFSCELAKYLIIYILPIPAINLCTLLY